MATLGDINSKVYSLTKTNINSYPDAAMLIDINLWYQKIVSMIFESEDDSHFDDNRNTNYPIATTPLVAGQRDYAIPVSENVLKIRRIDVTYDGVNWYRAMPLDLGAYPYGVGNAAFDTSLDGNFIQDAPMYATQFNSIFLFPMATAANVSSGATMQIMWERAMIPFSQSADYNGSTMSTSTSIPGIDLPWHMMLAYGAAYEYANANNLPQLANIKQDLQDWEARLRMAYGNKDKDFQGALNYTYDYEFGR